MLKAVLHKSIAILQESQTLLFPLLVPRLHNSRTAINRRGWGGCCCLMLGTQVSLTKIHVDKQPPLQECFMDLATLHSLSNGWHVPTT